MEFLNDYVVNVRESFVVCFVIFVIVFAAFASMFSGGPPQAS